MRLGLSRRDDYVVRSAICLARAYPAGASCKLRQVSEEMGVPRTFVAQILGDLVHAGLATSSPGANGGYRLAKSPEEVSLLDLVEAAGSLVSAGCADQACWRRAACPLRETWHSATALLRTTLGATSLGDLARRDQFLEAGIYPVPEDSHRHPGLTGGSDSAAPRGRCPDMAREPVPALPPISDAGTPAPTDRARS